MTSSDFRGTFRFFTALQALMLTAIAIALAVVIAVFLHREFGAGDWRWLAGVAVGGVFLAITR
jgi:Flp pilus assembly protein protease CpaA